MQLRRVAATMATVLISILISTTTTTQAHNITHILAKHPEFSSFNHYLTTTHLAAEINNRQTITVLAVDNAAMSTLLSKHLTIGGLKNVLSLHILLDYFGAKKLHQITNGTALAATMFQATGSATGSSGFVNITDLKGGKVGFGAEDNGGVVDATFVKEIETIPYNISVIQISQMIPSPEAEAPAPGPSEQNLTAIMSAHGCKLFAETLLASPAEQTYTGNLDGGLTVFCPADDALKTFLPKFKNLTNAGKQALLEYHGVPVYQSMSMLKSNNGPMNTLATDGADKFDFIVQNDGKFVTLKTKIVTAKITDTLIDEQPLAIFVIDKVLQPRELFKAVEAPAPAPSPMDDVADAPKGSKKKKHKAPPAPAASPGDAPADSPDGESADATADDSGSSGFGGGAVGFMAAAAAVLVSFLVV